MLVFVDTEFTDFVQIELISVALVADDGREFYAERTDFCRADCNDFVRAAVLPMLGRIAGAACTRAELTARLRAWFEALPEPATLVFDYFADWELLADAFLGDFNQPPANVGDKLMLGNEIVEDPIYQNALDISFAREWPRHHSLADAKAMMAGYRAWVIRTRCDALGLSLAHAQRLVTVAQTGYADTQALLWVLGLDFSTLAPLAPRRWLWMAAQTASVSYRETLTPEALTLILTTGSVPAAFSSHVLHLLDEAPIQLVVMAVEQAAQQSEVPIATIWHNVERIAGRQGVWDTENLE